MSGTEMQRTKEAAAEIMRKKQQAGTSGNSTTPRNTWPYIFRMQAN